MEPPREAPSEQPAPPRQDVFGEDKPEWWMRGINPMWGFPIGMGLICGVAGFLIHNEPSSGWQGFWFFLIYGILSGAIMGWFYKLYERYQNKRRIASSEQRPHVSHDETTGRFVS